MARAATTAPMARATFLCSTFGGIGVVVFLLGGYLLITKALVGPIFSPKNTPVLLVIFFDGIGYLTAFVLSIVGLVGSLSWRKAGGRGRLNVFSIVLASLGILVVTAVLASVIVIVIIFETYLASV